MSTVAVKQPNFFARHWPVLSFVGVFVLFVVTVLVRDPLRSFLAMQRVNSALPIARAAGVPITGRDVYPDPPANVPNAAPLMEKAFIAARKLDSKRRTPIIYYATTIKRPGIDEAMKIAAPAIELSHKAAAIGACHFNDDPDRANLLEFPKEGQTKFLINLLCVDAEMHAEKGDWKLATGELRDARTLSSYMNFPSMTVLYLRATSEQMIQQATELCVAKANPEALDAYAQIAKDETQLDFLQYFKGAAFGEIAIAKNIDKSNYNVEDADFKNKFDTKEIPDNWRSREAMAQELKSYAKILNELKGTGSERMKVKLALHNFAERHYEEVSVGRYYLLGNQSNYSDLYDVTLKPQANWRCLQVVIGALQYKAKHGSLPTTMAEAIGKDVLDPFTGKPLKYKVVGSNLRVYSVAPDGTDNKGMRMNEVGAARGSMTYDLAATYPPMQKLRP